MKISFCLLLSCLWPLLPAAASGPGPGNARGAGLSGSVVAVPGWGALQYNIAGIISLKKPVFGVYANTRFNLKELTTVSFTGILPLGKGFSSGVEFSRFGDKYYNEQEAGLGLAHRLGPVRLGLKASLHQVHLEEMGSRRALVLSAGGQSEIIPHLTFGAAIHNLTQARLAADQDERLPTTMQAGLAYQAAPQVLVTLQTTKSLELPADVLAGMEYILRQKLFFRTGFSWQNQSVTGGFGIKLKAFQLDYALGSHTLLGMSNHVSLTYEWK